MPLDPQRRVFVAFSNSALSSFVPYLPQAAGIATARLFTRSVLALFYAGRLANLAVAVLLTALAIRRTPIARPLFFLLASTPMATFERASVSADAFTDAIALYAVALFLGIAFGRKKLGAGVVGLALLVAALLGLSKTAYLFLTLLVLLVPASRLPPRLAPAPRRFVRDDPRDRTWRCGVLVLRVQAILSDLPVVPGYRPPAAARRRGRRSLGVPRNGCVLLREVGAAPFGSVRRSAGLARYAAPPVTRRGHGSPARTRRRDLRGCRCQAAREAPRPPDRNGRPVSLLWTSVLLYVVVSPLGSGEIGGTQGRYLIPLAAPFFLSWAGIARPIDWDRRAGWIVGIAVAASAGALFVVWRRYYV